jgi:uncharacterized protein YndB with AHSA1/START domain
MQRPGLAVSAPGEREIVMTRDFAAPRELVFEAWTRPELLARWYGVFGGWSMAVCEIDLRVGGACRFLWRGPEGEIGLRGTYQEIVAPERLVVVAAYDQSWYPGDERSTTTFAEHRGRTTVTTRLRFQSLEARDAVLRSPMEQGVAGGYASLDRLLAERSG